MISNDNQEKLVERLVNRIELLNEYILKKIGRRINEIGKMNASQLHQVKQMLMYGEDIEKITNKIAQITRLNVQDIYDIFDEEAKINQSFAEQYYKARDIEFIMYNKNKPLQDFVKGLANITAGQYINIARTSVIGYTIRDQNNRLIFKDVSTLYRDCIDKAIMNVTMGKTTYQEEMRDIVKSIGTSGIKTVDYMSGTHRRLDTAVRMNTLDGMRNLTNKLQEQFGEEFGADGVEISVHLNPAPDHEEAQGRQFSKEQYENLQNYGKAVDYKGKTIDMHLHGENFRKISQYNCYHYEFDIVLGVNKPEYTDEQLREIINNNNKGFEYNGRHYTNYEGTQLQRQIETKIREQKDLQIIAKASGDKELVGKAQQRITQLTHKYKELSNISGLPTKMDRLKVTGYKRISVAKM